MATSPISFQGITSGLQTDQLVNAIMSVEGQWVQRLRDKQTLNTQKSDAFKNLRNGMSDLAISFGTMMDSMGLTKTEATTALQGMITKYNSVIKTYNDAKAARKPSDPNDLSINPGPLTNDATARNVVQDIRMSIHEVPSGLEGASLKTLSDLGVKTNSDGTLTLDVGVFQNAFDSNPQGVKDLTKGLGEALRDQLMGMISYNGPVESARSVVETQNKDLAKRIESGQVLLDERRKDLNMEFDRMESVIAQLRSISGSLYGLQ